MACPFFYPVARLERGAGAKTLPLGDAWSGYCQVHPDHPSVPGDQSLVPHCNLGYAQDCPQFPSGSADAVRFSVSRDQSGIVRIHYVVEKGHLPVEHGPLAYSRDTNTFLVQHPNRMLQRQAEAYMESYLLRKSTSTCSSPKQ